MSVALAGLNLDDLGDCEVGPQRRRRGPGPTRAVAQPPPGDEQAVPVSLNRKTSWFGQIEVRARNEAG
jgi:hypothetical protein